MKENGKRQMKLPVQSAPVDRRQSAVNTFDTLGIAGYASDGVRQSQQCGCPNLCIGACAFGHCQGVCV
jgi:hypothetical protein